MKRFPVIVCIIWFCAVWGHAIGLQHGLFRSQATQGKAWTGTMTFVREAYNITVFPDYLDVELEWELGVNGTKPDSFTNALEIVGNINLEHGSVVVGMLLWNNDKLLKAKLKTAEQATKQYEEVVDRNSDIPPFPRDPVILKWVRDDNYDISIFPVSWGKTRTLRMRYLIPAFSIDGINKIGYPYAFSPIATVSIKNGPGVDGYKIVSGTIQKTFTVPGTTLLSSNDYSFQSYGSSGKAQISSIIPLVSGYSEGSRLFMKGFKTENFKGQMIHFAGMKASDVLKLAVIKDDYVILWRWNHPDILKKYACQIVAQSNLIKVFLATLQASNKRVGMIVDMQGGERKIFELDKKGGTAYQQMMDFLSSLSALADQKPPKGAPPSFTTQETDSIVKASFDEFQAAIKLALSLFRDDDAQKHLLILTAGPRWTAKYAASQAADWDSTVEAVSLNSYLAGNGLPYDTLYSAQAMHWQGVNLDNFIAKPRIGLKIYASLTNGKDTARTLAADYSAYQGYYSQSQGNEMRVYSAQPIREQVIWSLYAGNKQVAEYHEKPFIVDMPDEMQYARLIGSSPALVPLAEYMPSSLASTLGFIDLKYALLALEQDTLNSRMTARYAAGGVPTLHQADIFPSADEKAQVPVTEWLKTRQPVSNFTPIPNININLHPIMVLANPAEPMVKVEGDMVRFLVADSYGSYYYPPAQPPIDSVPMDASAIASNPLLKVSSFQKAIRIFADNGRIVIAFNEIQVKNRAQLKAMAYDIRGKVVKRWTCSDVSHDGRLSWSPRDNGLAAGIFVVRISLGSETISNRIIVR
jgi:hypothetical protein